MRQNISFNIAISIVIFILNLMQRRLVYLTNANMNHQISQ